MVIFSKVKLGVSPDVNALASLIICLVGVCVLFAGYLMRRAERQRLRGCADGRALSSRGQ